MLRIFAIGLLLGGLLGTGLAYLLALRRRTFTRRLEPELLLEAPLLAEVPAFSEEGIYDPLPVRSAPSSAAAEAFRFAAAALHIREASAGAKSIVMVSATVGEGKTTVAANTAIAAAHEGARVLLIDADFGDQALTRMMLGSEARGPGLTDVQKTGFQLGDALRTIDVTGGASLSLLGRGQLPVTAANFFRSEAARGFFRDVGELFDLVLIDAPPLLQVAYSATLLRHAQAALVVVPHRGTVTKIEEVAERLQFIGIPTLGYVYNRAPLRPEMTVTEGSLRDVIRADDLGAGLGAEGILGHKG
jgi:Mrp family chromosome partitioning ATPase